MERLRVVENKESIDILEMIDGKTPDEVALEFQRLTNHYERDVLSLDKLVKFDVEYDYDDFNAYIVTFRWETDEEFGKRKAKADKARETRAKHKAAKDAADYATYQKLRARFEE